MRARRPVPVVETVTFSPDRSDETHWVFDARGSGLGIFIEVAVRVARGLHPGHSTDDAAKEWAKGEATKIARLAFVEHERKLDTAEGW